MNPYASTAEIYATALVFIRVGAIVMLIPGLGESSVPPRLRLSFALLLSLCLGPIAAPYLPPLASTVAGMAGTVMKELVIGLMIGALLRLFLVSLATAGEIIALQTTLSFAQTTNPMQAQPGTTVTTFLTVLATTLLFATNLHHLFFAAIAHSYTQFAPSKPVMIADAAQLAVQTVGKGFALGVQLSAPILVFSLVFNVAIGFVGRVMPQFQLFFVASPLSVLFGLSILALSLGTFGLIWIERYEEYLQLFN